MEGKIATDSNPEESGEWPPDYEPPSLEELGSVWEETGSVMGVGADAMGQHGQPGGS